MNNVTLLGRLTRDPELTYNSATGNAVARFSIAVDKQLSREKKQEMEAKKQPTADFINIVCWGRLAEACNSFTSKGKRVLVQGRIQTGSYEAQDGTRRYTTDVVANSVEFIDWKDRDDRASSYGSQPTGGAQANAQSAPADDFFGNDFSPVDDDRIPF